MIHASRSVRRRHASIDFDRQPQVVHGAGFALSHSIVIAMFVVCRSSRRRSCRTCSMTSHRFIDIVPPTPPPAPRKQPEIKRAEPIVAAPTKASRTAITEKPAGRRELIGRLMSRRIVGGCDDLDRSARASAAVPRPPSRRSPSQSAARSGRPIRSAATDPVYPAIARRRGVQGIVIIEATHRRRRTGDQRARSCAADPAARLRRALDAVRRGNSRRRC